MPRLPLIDALMQRYQGTPFVITTVTPTGSDRVRRVYGDRVFNVYLPYDLPASIRRFLKRVQPRLVVVMETEIWPNLFFACRARGMPVMVANARLSEKSLRGYGPVRPLAQAARWPARYYVAAQSATDAARLRDLGADPERLGVVGNLKYDMTVPDDLVAEAGNHARRRGARSDRCGWRRARTTARNCRCSRHMPRCCGNFPMRCCCSRRAIRSASSRSRWPVAVSASSRARAARTATPTSDTQCFVVDTLGELLRFYAAADVAFVGGSLVPIGGHNVLEPAALSVPVIVGPQTFNFAEITAPA